jgi:hypothetical protein
MEIWAILIILILIILIGVSIGGGLYLSRNSASDAQSTILNSFTQTFGDNPTAPINIPPLVCPVGKEINIIGAWIEVADPMNQCWSQGPSSVLKCYCGDSSACTNGASPASNPGNVCLNMNNYQNTVCNPNSKSYQGCRPRDVSAYFAEKCDGKQSINLSIDPTKDTWFGPWPCNLTLSGDPSQNTDLSTYNKLPVNDGLSAGSIPNSQNNNPVTPTQTQGYYIHGIYTCK